MSTRSLYALLLFLFRAACVVPITMHPMKRPKQNQNVISSLGYLCRRICQSLTKLTSKVDRQIQSVNFDAIMKHMASRCTFAKVVWKKIATRTNTIDIFRTSTGLTLKQWWSEMAR